jgi:hypothetical protein
MTQRVKGHAMKNKLMVLAAIGGVALFLAAAPGANSGAKKQHVTITASKSGIDNFLLVPRKGGSIQRDSGSADYCCWTQKFITRDGQTVEVNDPVTTLRSKKGELVLRERIEWTDAGNGYSIGIGTWKVIKGTGAYKGVTGAGRSASSWLPSGPVSWRNDGFLTSH